MTCVAPQQCECGPIGSCRLWLSAQAAGCPICCGYAGGAAAMCSIPGGMLPRCTACMVQVHHFCCGQGVRSHASNFVRPGARRPLRRGGLPWHAVRRFVRRQTDPGVAWSTPGSPQGVAAPCQAPCSGTTHLPRALLAALPIRSCIAGCTEQRACSATGRSESRRSSMLSCLRISRLALAGQCITYSSL